MKDDNGKSGVRMAELDCLYNYIADIYRSPLEYLIWDWKKEGKCCENLECYTG